MMTMMMMMMYGFKVVCFEMLLGDVCFVPIVIVILNLDLMGSVKFVALSVDVDVPVPSILAK